MIIVLLLVVIYLAIGTYLMLKDISNPLFHEMMEASAKAQGWTKDELRKMMFKIKVMVILTWPNMFAYYTKEKEEDEE